MNANKLQNWTLNLAVWVEIPTPLCDFGYVTKPSVPQCPQLYNEQGTTTHLITVLKIKGWNAGKALGTMPVT